MGWIVDLFGSLGKVIFWLVTTIVIPATVWFTMIKVDVTKARAETESLRQEFKDEKQVIREERAYLRDKVDTMAEDISFIKGKLSK